MRITIHRLVSFAPTTFIRVSQEDTSNIQCTIYIHTRIQNIKNIQKQSHKNTNDKNIQCIVCILVWLYSILYIFCLLVWLYNISYTIYCLYSCVTVYHIWHIICILVLLYITYCILCMFCILVWLYILYIIYCMLFVFFCYTLMMVPGATEKCRWAVIYDNTYFIGVHCLVGLLLCVKYLEKLFQLEMSTHVSVLSALPFSTDLARLTVCISTLCNHQTTDIYFIIFNMFSF
jgi:hypothetical protein